MNITMYHIIIPLVAIIGSITLVVILFLRVYKRSICENSCNKKSYIASDSRGDGVVDVIFDKSNVTNKKNIEKKLKSFDKTAVENIVDRERNMIKRIAANPRDAEAYELLGQVYIVQDNFVDASECFQQVCVLDPRNTSAIHQLHRVKKMIKGSKIK